MNTVTCIETGLLSSLLSVGLALGPTAAVADDCSPRVLNSPTHFPARAHLRGQSGTVFIEVLVDEYGRAADATLHKSSGHRLLDRAATASVRTAWTFDVSTCARKDLPANQVISVEYRNPEYQD